MQISSKSDALDFSKEDARYLQQADLLRAANSSAQQSEGKELVDEVWWFSD
jgi:hypothetical protein